MRWDDGFSTWESVYMYKLIHEQKVGVAVR